MLPLFPNEDYTFAVQAVDAENQPLSYRWFNNGIFVSDKR